MKYNVYLSGHIDEHEDPWEWRNDIKEKFEYDDQLKFTDPVEQFPKYDDNEMEVVWWCITQAVICDGLFIKWDNETLTVGTIVEMTIAFLFHNPIVVWYDGDDGEDELSPFLKALAVDIYTDKGATMSRLKEEMKQFTLTPW